MREGWWIFAADTVPFFTLQGDDADHSFSVGAPAFMRGKERFSAPEKARLQSMRFSVGIAKSRG